MKEQLTRFSIFRGLTDGELTTLGKMCRGVQFKAGEQIFQAEEDAKHLYLLLEGKAELRFHVVYYHASVEVTLEKASGDDILGWSALVPPYKYTLSAYAIEDCSLLQISQADIFGLCENDNHLCAVLKGNVAGIVGQRFHALQQMLIKEIQESLRKQDSLA